MALFPAFGGGALRGRDDRLAADQEQRRPGHRHQGRDDQVRRHRHRHPQRAEGSEGPAGQNPAKGDKGDKGDPGAPGAPARPGSAGCERVSDNTPQLELGPRSLVVNCPAGKSVVGTGFDIAGATTGAARPIQGGDGRRGRHRPRPRLGDVLRLRAEGRQPPRSGRCTARSSARRSRSPGAARSTSQSVNGPPPAGRSRVRAPRRAAPGKNCIIEGVSRSAGRLVASERV